MIFRDSKKKKSLGYNDLPAKEKKRIIKKAIEEANKEQFEVVKAYRNSRCHVSG